MMKHPRELWKATCEQANRFRSANEWKKKPSPRSRCAVDGPLVVADQLGMPLGGWRQIDPDSQASIKEGFESCHANVR
jgi:hypothetical protein